MFLLCCEYLTTQEAPETPDTERESMQVADVSMTDTETTKVWCVVLVRVVFQVAMQVAKQHTSSPTQQPTTERSWWFGNSSGKERRTPHVAMPT